MSFTVRIVRTGSTLFTFATPTPFVEPKHDYEFDTFQPPRPIAVNKTWTIEGILYGASETLCNNAWGNLVAILENGAAYPDGVEFVRDSTVFESISASSGYSLFKIDQIHSPRSEQPANQWRNEMRFSIRVTGRKRLAGLYSIGNISKITQVDSYAYGESGLLIRTLSGEVEVSSGSAYSVAQQLGITPLPSSSFGYVTNGPGGVNVEKVDLADRVARFTCVIQQNAEPLPANVGPSYSKHVSTVQRDGEITVTTTASAVGAGALAAVQGAQPGGDLFSKTIGQDSKHLTATAVYVQRKQDTNLGSVVMHQTFTTKGGGVQIRWTRRTNNRKPVKHVLPRTEVVISELVHIQMIGSPGLPQFKFPAPVTGLAEDRDAMAFEPWPRLVSYGATRANDTWEAGLRRSYSAASLADAREALGQASFAPGQGSDVSSEIDRQAT